MMTVDGLFGAGDTIGGPPTSSPQAPSPKAVLAYGEWVEQCVLRPVPHRQYVFTVPRLIRPFFAYRRSLLGERCRIIARSLTEAYRVAVSWSEEK